MRWALLLLTLASCSLEEALEGAGCRSNADCDKSQACVRTLHQDVNGLIGQCSSNGSCIVGEQLGCKCDGQACTNFDLLAVPHPELMDSIGAPLCFCCQGAAECAEDQEPLVEAVTDDRTSASCRCCPRCDAVELQVREFDDGNIVDCSCAEPMSTDTDTSTST